MRVQWKRLVLHFEEPTDSFLSLFKTDTDVLVHDRPNQRINNNAKSVVTTIALTGCAAQVTLAQILRNVYVRASSHVRIGQCERLYINPLKVYANALWSHLWMTSGLRTGRYQEVREYEPCRFNHNIKVISLLNRGEKPTVVPFPSLHQYKSFCLLSTRGVLLWPCL